LVWRIHANACHEVDLRRVRLRRLSAGVQTVIKCFIKFAFKDIRLLFRNTTL